MKTKLLIKKDIKIAASILKNGGIVAIPTETVYGLAANIFNENALKNVFKAKGRPADNPLIVHIADEKSLAFLVKKMPKKAQILAENFWPGPLTLILPKQENISNLITAGLNTIAVRWPSNEIAQKIILESRVPLAAPSANISGSPSPTSAEHVFIDLDGKIDAILDGGGCEIGLESTVISFDESTPKLLRPGAITVEEIEKLIGKIEVDKVVLNKLKYDEVAIAPGMKYRHYSPKAEVIMFDGGGEAEFAKFIKKNADKNSVALCFEEDIKNLDIPYICYGKKTDFKTQAKCLFSAFREADEKKFKKVLTHAPEKKGVGLAVFNRMAKAAGK